MTCFCIFFNLALIGSMPARCMCTIYETEMNKLKKTLRLRLQKPAGNVMALAPIQGAAVFGT